MKSTSRKPSGHPHDPGVPSLLNLAATATIELANGGGADADKALPRFRMVAYTGAPMQIAGWRYPVVLDLAGLAIPSQSRPIRFGHDPLAGVGHADSIRIDDGQLVATGVVSRDTLAAREVVVSAKNGFPWQASVGAGVEEFQFIKENQKVVVNGRALTGLLNVVRKATLGEISFVDLGADGRTSATVAAINPSGEAPVNNADANTDNQGASTPPAQGTTPPAERQPTAEEVRAFLANPDPQKRARKIEELLGRPGYAALWATSSAICSNRSSGKTTVCGRRRPTSGVSTNGSAPASAKTLLSTS